MINGTFLSPQEERAFNLTPPFAIVTIYIMMLQNAYKCCILFNIPDGQRHTDAPMTNYYNMADYLTGRVVDTLDAVGHSIVVSHVHSAKYEISQGSLTIQIITHLFKFPFFSLLRLHIFG